MFLDYFMAKVAPSQDSEIKRTNVFSKLKSLIENALGNLIPFLILLGCPEEVLVLRYGSDPLKTYLPESDIDVTVLRKSVLSEGRDDLTSLAQLKQ